MKYSGEIDFKKSTISIEKKVYNISTELKRNTISIDRIIALWFLEKQTKQILIDRETYRVIRVNVPVPFNWVNLQNDYLPLEGEYFLN